MSGPTTAMRLLPGASLLLLLAGCGERTSEAPKAGTKGAIDRSVADIRAAEGATRSPAEMSRSVGELTAAKAKDEPPSDAP